MRLLLPLVAFIQVLFVSAVQAQNSSFEPINTDDITIVRDKWGVPHIYGKTDADVAYGLAWANAEDDFFTIQELIISAKGKAGKVWGKEGAQRDFFTHAIGIAERAKKDYHNISEEYQKYMDAYCQGINAFANTHKKEIRVKGIFPLSPVDIVTSYMFALSALSRATGPVGSIVSGKYDQNELSMGSNAFAFNSHKTDNGSSMLCINPHQPIEGPFSWYEAHLCSEEGMNIHGALFPGGPTVLLGSNEHLGWAHTYNHLDLVDVFKLEMHPKKKYTYKYNNEWRTLKKRPIWLKVKLKKWLPVVPVKKTTYWSEMGATLQSKNGSFYAVKFGANEKVRMGEQSFKMNKATNFTEFYEAVNISSIALYNIVYADRNDTVFYINNALIPKRNINIDYTKHVTCNSDSSCWSEYYHPDDLVQMTNPNCGWIFNTNNNPTHCTAREEWGDLANYPQQFGWGVDRGDNNRAERFLELMDETASEKVSFERMKQMKFDYQYPACDTFLNSIENLFHAHFEDYPELTPLIQAINRWDKVADKESIGAGVFLITFQHLWDMLGYGDSEFKGKVNIAESLYLEALIWAKDQIDTYYNGELPALGMVQRHVRANVNLPLNGFPDALAANYNQPFENGRYKPYVADSYVQFSEWPKDGGPVKIETLIPFGVSTRPDSPHYTDQMKLYANQQTKTMTLVKEEVFKNAERIYHPGE